MEDNIKLVNILCQICDKTFYKKSNLKRHYLTHGKGLIQSDPATIPCDEEDENLKNKDDYTITFATFSEFLTWKETIERETLSSYVKNRGQTKGVHGQVYAYYDCCRSGSYKPKEHRKRNIKSQQSKKIGYACPARMHVTISKTNIVVKFFKDHNHLPELEHISLPKSLRASIAGKLKEGVAPQQIIGDIRKSASAVDRSLLINNKDIYNIKRDFHIGKEMQQHEDDATSVNLWVQEMAESAPTENLKSTVQSMTEMIIGLNDKVTLENSEYDQIKKHLGAVISILTKHSSNKVESTNKRNIEKQNPFFSSKKKRKVVDALRNLTFAEPQSLEESLLNDCDYINVHTEFDHDYVSQ